MAPDFAARLGLEAGGDFDDFMASLATPDAARLASALEALRAGATPDVNGDSFTLTVATADGERSFEASAGTPRDDAGGGPAGLVLWLRDVSAATAAMAGASAERDRLRAMVDKLPLPVWRRAADQTLVYCNQAYAAIVETDVASATAGTGVELVAEADARKARDLAEEARASGEAHVATHHVIVDGARRLLKITETPLDGETVGIAWDVTDVEEASRTLDQHIEAHAAVIERLATAIAIYGPDKQLEFFNSAFAKLYMTWMWSGCSPSRFWAKFSKCCGPSASCPRWPTSPISRKSARPCSPASLNR
jgi:PAS domain-containing protein